jgi:hypothetical protein
MYTSALEEDDKLVQRKKKCKLCTSLRLQAGVEKKKMLPVHQRIRRNHTRKTEILFSILTSLKC